MIDFADRQRHWISKGCEESSNHERTSKVATLELMPQENMRLLQELEANRAFILLAYLSDADLLRRADPEIRRLFEIVDRPISPAGAERAT